jgi:hypothetical protein
MTKTIQKTKEVGTITSIKTTEKHGTIVKYVSIGTIGWLKTNTNEVRQCRLERVTFKDRHVPILEWKVGGMKDNLFGYNWNTIEGLGVIYNTQYEAEHGSSNESFNYSKFAPNDTFNVRTILTKRYGNFSNEMLYDNGFCCWDCNLAIHTITMEKNGTLLLQYNTPFKVVIDKNGVNITIPSVDRGEAFLTNKAALATYKPLPIYTLDDEDEAKTFTIKAEAVFSRTIEVKADSYEEAVEIAKKILRKDNFNEDDNNGTQFS